MSTQLNGSVLRAFRILDLFAAGYRELSAGDVAHELKVNLTTAHRFLHTLEHAGALRMTARGVFALGYVFADLGEKLARDGGAAPILQPVLDDLARTTHEACMATRFDQGSAMCIARSVPERALYVDIRVGTRLEAHSTAHGKLWLAFMENEKRDTWLETAQLQHRTENTITGKPALIQELDHIRAEGFAINNAECDNNIYAIAVPVFNHHGNMVSALSSFGSNRMIAHQHLAGLREHLRDAAQAAQTALYGAQPDERTN
ncbi:IclR family transcriptional regulator [Thalassospira profundimaris]|uniref:IclR family transcriptional regulator n=1 Tax=Thalassospira profundimaris TaxID=502049 RepID=A0A367XLA9_9PROT|nr:IclR family transcriptional regulator [Thalassospira profundimaris]RCK53581.1 IclR family transcriptional regulator [Thalassospira profundimaris]